MVLKTHTKIEKWFPYMAGTRARRKISAQNPQEEFYNK